MSLNHRTENQSLTQFDEKAVSRFLKRVLFHQVNSEDCPQFSDVITSEIVLLKLKAQKKSKKSKKSKLDPKTDFEETITDIMVLAISNYSEIKQTLTEWMAQYPQNLAPLLPLGQPAEKYQSTNQFNKSFSYYSSIFKSCLEQDQDSTGILPLWRVNIGRLKEQLAQSMPNTGVNRAGHMGEPLVTRYKTDTRQSNLKRTSFIGSWKDKTIEDKPYFPENNEVEILNRDCVAAAKDLSEAGKKVALLSFANQTLPLGHTFTGHIAREEHLAKVTSLPGSLLEWTHSQGGGTTQNKELYYHPNSFKQTDVLISTETVYLDENFKKEQPFKLDIITSAALIVDTNNKNLPYSDNDGYYEFQVGYAILAAKIYNQIAAAINNGNEAIVLGAFGCGMFNNNPELIANLYRKILCMNEFLGKIKIQFAIKGNPQGNNVLQFTKVFQQPLQALPYDEEDEIRASIAAIYYFETSTQTLMERINEIKIGADKKNANALSTLQKLVDLIRVGFVKKTIKEIPTHIQEIIDQISQDTLIKVNDINKVIAMLSNTRHFSEISYPTEGQPLKGEAAIQAILRSKSDGVGPHYLLVRKENIVSTRRLLCQYLH